jgi:hypothetical protein
MHGNVPRARYAVVPQAHEFGHVARQWHDTGSMWSRLGPWTVHCHNSASKSETFTFKNVESLYNEQIQQHITQENSYSIACTVALLCAVLTCYLIFSVPFARTGVCGRSLGLLQPTLAFVQVSQLVAVAPLW